MIQSSGFCVSPEERCALELCGEVSYDVPMSNLTTFKTGGPADAVICPQQPEAVGEIVAIARKANLPVTIIGGGSNLLVGDGGIRGLVIRICNRGGAQAAISVENENGAMYAQAGVRKEDFIRFAINAGFGGIEFMAGIPGCIGGGIVMNAGTYMGSFIDILKRIDCVDGNGTLLSLDVTSDMSSYRHFDIPKDWIVLGAHFELPRAAEREKVSGSVRAIMEDRAKKHPLAYPCAGSVFKNPEGHSAWRLINDAGLKGYRIGGAQVSELHTNFIVNYDGATSRDIRELVALVQERVEQRFGIRLETEIKMVGDF